ncbi:MAG: hypothetical protein OXU20_40510 [Myxococcales bacterium]|nr:hypothetical protein [Myxococcales bacterium]MDD9969907.1 hypothetical protein [Myxococcales bacterium]
MSAEVEGGSTGEAARSKDLAAKECGGDGDVFDVDLEELEELSAEEAGAVESDVAPAGERSTTGIHRRLSSPPPVPQEARPSSRSSVPPPPPPPMPADFAALRSQLQRVNSRCSELVCERARLVKQLEARDRALDTLRLQNADLARQSVERDRSEEQAMAALGDGEPSALQLARRELARLRAETSGFAAMKIELERLRETQADAKRMRDALTEVKSLSAALDQAQAEVARQRAKTARLEADARKPDEVAGRLAALEQQLDRLEQQRCQQAGIATEALEELEAQRALVAELEGRLKGQAMVGAEALESERMHRDRMAYELRELRARVGEGGRGLDAIIGVGPTFAGRLRTLGIDVAAIAAWNQDDIVRVAAEIQTQSARIVRQRWVEQARQLLEAGELG